MNFVLEDAIAVCLVVGYTVRIASQLQLRTSVGALDTTTSFRSAIVDPRRSLGAGELWHITRVDRSAAVFLAPKQDLRSVDLPPRPANNISHPWTPVAIKGSGVEMNFEMKET